MFCPKCGANLVDGAEFCQKCGAQLKKKEEPAPEPEQVFSEPVAAVPAKRSSKTPIIVAACMAAVIVLIAVVGYVIPEVSRRREEKKIGSILIGLKDCSPFVGEDDLKRWDVRVAPSYGEVFNYAVSGYWDVTDVDAKEVEVSGRSDYSGEGVHIYFHGDSTLPYKIECGGKSFTSGGDVTNFLYDMVDAYMDNEEFIHCTFPKFCGKKVDGYLSGSYTNKFFGFELDIGQSWRFPYDSEIEEVTGAATKSTVDVSDLKYGDRFTDVVAANNDTGNFILIEFMYYGGRAVSQLAGYSSEKEYIEDFMEQFYSSISESDGEYLNYSSYGQKVRLGNLDAVSASMSFNYENGASGVEKDFFAIKNDVVIVIAMYNYVSDDMSEMEAMFSAA